jgi:putative salt-induced outer membrane protein YdiY
MSRFILSYFMRFIFILWLGMLAVSSLAGEIKLTNGDVVHGQLIKVSGINVYWKSDTFGDVTVSKSKITHISFEQAVKLDGQAGVCYLHDFDGVNLIYSCDGKVLKIAFSKEQSIYPFANYNDAVYTYEGQMSLALDMKRGNKVSDDLDFTIETKYRKDDFRHLTNISYESDSVDEGPTTEIYNLDYRLDWFFDEGWFWYNELKYAVDESKRISNSYIFSTGVGVQVWNYSHSALSFDAGIEYQMQNFDPSATDLLNPDWEGTTTESYWRLGYDYRYKLPWSMNFISSAEYLSNVDDATDWVLEFEAGLSVPLGERLFSEYKFEYDFDNQPNGNSRREDKQLSIGVGYKW